LIRDPFTVLGVADDAGDAEIRRRYLALVRDFPPDRAPERFQELRAAYEALSDERKRLATKLLHTNSAALSRLSMDALRAGSTDGPPARATRQTVAALLTEGITLVSREQSPPQAGEGRQRGR
jgi:curved DNA-binding protein CbpA